MSEIGFAWRFSPGRCASNRTPGSCASLYTPIQEKRGFWANCGKPFAYTLACFGVCLFVLLYGWNHGLAVGGVPYYCFAIVSVVLWGAYVIHIVRQHFVLARAAASGDAESVVLTVNAGEPVEVTADVTDVIPGDTVQLAYGLWGDTDRHVTEMEHRGGDRFVGRMDVGQLLRLVGEGVIHYRVEHIGREKDVEQNPKSLIVRLAAAD